MVGGVNGWNFKRGLDAEVMQKLEVLHEQAPWLQEVLADNDLILGIRHNYLDIYRYGQRLFHIASAGKANPLKVTTHPKYLVDPDLEQAVSFDGERFCTAGIKPLIEVYSLNETITKMKRAAAYYSGREKKGVHSIVRGNPNVLDIEVAFAREVEQADGQGGRQRRRAADRIDLACLSEREAGICLRFWEAKHYSNPELRSSESQAAVVGQIRGYQELLAAHSHEILTSFAIIARNLYQIAAWTGGKRKVGPLIERVARGEVPTLEMPPVVGLVLFGYDAVHKANADWLLHIKKLEDSGIEVKRAGRPSSICL
jgi:hypothetical protein